MSASEFFSKGSRLYKAARRVELSMQRASAAASKAADALKSLPPVDLDAAKVCTDFNGWEWTAVYDDYDGPGSPIGTGKTEQQAIEHLMELLITSEEK